MSSLRWPRLNSGGDRRLVTVVVKTGQSGDAIAERAPSRFLVSVKARAVQGAANARALALVAEHLGVSERAVRIVKGHTTPNKIVEIRN